MKLELMKSHSMKMVSAIGVAAGLVAVGCVSESDDGDSGDGDGDAPAVVGDGDGDTVSGDGDGDMVSGDGDGLGGGSSVTGLETPLPMAVDGNYVPSGFMGDTDDVSVTPSDEVPDGTCNDDRAPGEPVGDCHIATYSAETVTENWGGVFWQYPDGNWGDVPGLIVAPGATKVVFSAKGEVGGEVVDFMVGMEGADSTSGMINVSLTTDWTEYEIELDGDYSEVFGPFGFAANNEDNPEGVTIYIDDIEWQ